MGKSKNKKNEQSGQGPDSPDQAPPSPGQEIPNEASEEEDPPNSAVLAAVTALQHGITQIKSNICETIDSGIKSVYADLKEEIAAAKEELQTSIATLESTLAAHDNIIQEIERSATFHLDSVSTPQRQETHLNSVTVAKRRALFSRNREILQGRPGVKYSLLYPVRLLVTFNGEQTSFTDPRKAQEYAERLFRTQSDTTT